jgi:hypothetical protein
VAIAVGSIGLAIRGVDSGLNDIEKGMKKFLYDSQSGASKASDAISDMTNGILDNGKAAEMLRKGRGIGFSDDQIGKLAKVGVNLGLISENGDAAAGAMNLLDAVAKGKVKSIQEMSPALSRMISQDEHFKAATTDAARSQAAMNAVMKNYQQVLEDTGNVADSSFGRMLGLITKIKDTTEGLLPMLGGMGKIAGSMLLPLAGGASIGFIGGPIAGVIGLAIGGIVTAGLTAGFLRLGKTLMEGGNPEARIGGMKDLATIMFPSFMEAMFTGKAGKTVAIEDSKLLAATGETDINKARARGEDIYKGAVGFGKGIFNFGEGFATSAKSVYSGVSGFINKFFKVDEQFNKTPLLERFQNAGTNIGSLLGSIAGLLGALLEAIVKGFFVLTDKLSIFGAAIAKQFGIELPSDKKPEDEKKNEPTMLEKGFNFLSEPVKDVQERVFGKAPTPNDLDKFNQELIRAQNQLKKEDPSILEDFFGNSKGKLGIVDWTQLDDRRNEAIKTPGKEDDARVMEEIKNLIKSTNEAIIELKNMKKKQLQSGPR